MWDSRFFDGWIGWAPLVLELNSLFPVVDRYLFESLSELRNYARLYHRLTSNPGMLLPETRGLMERIQGNSTEIKESEKSNEESRLRVVRRQE